MKDKVAAGRNHSSAARRPVPRAQGMLYVHITTRDACSDGGGPVRKRRDPISQSRDSSHHHPSFFLGHLTYPSTIFPLPGRRL